MNYTHYGNAGIGFNLVKEFTNQQEMINEFSRGSGYKEVRYGEYVIIGNDGGEHAGKIYRRGYNIGNSLGGAVYITNIVAANRTSLDTMSKNLDTAIQNAHNSAKESIDSAIEDMNAKAEDTLNEVEAKAQAVVDSAASLYGVAVQNEQPQAEHVAVWIDTDEPVPTHQFLTADDIAKDFGTDEYKVVSLKFFTEQINALKAQIDELKK